MNVVTKYLRELWAGAAGGWNRFWFTPSDPATLGLIRILAGAMLFYTHLVWSLDLTAFFGADAWLTPDLVASIHGTPFAWSYLDSLHSPATLWTAHIAALVVFALLIVGLWTRVTSILGFLITVAYANRVPGALFGLDQINGLLALYLAVGPSGDAYSLDRLLLRRRTGNAAPSPPSSGANIAIRLIQVHMAIIYLFAGLSKLQGETWHNGRALWYAFANLEYQSLDMTWLAKVGELPINFMTHLTILWELSYIVLVWPRLTRPIMLALAVPLHLGIAFCMGMITFGLVMLIGNLAFVSPALVRAIIQRQRDPGQGRAGGNAPEERQSTKYEAPSTKSERPRRRDSERRPSR